MVLSLIKQPPSFDNRNPFAYSSTSDFGWLPLFCLQANAFHFWCCWYRAHTSRPIPFVSRDVASRTVAIMCREASQHNAVWRFCVQLHICRMIITYEPYCIALYAFTDIYYLRVLYVCYLNNRILVYLFSEKTCF